LRPMRPLCQATTNAFGLDLPAARLYLPVAARRCSG
jgi:hypothetical protein